MDSDDAPLRKNIPLSEVEKEDLSTISVEELEERVQRLEAEITRTKAEIKAKSASKAAAEAFFKS